MDARQNPYLAGACISHKWSENTPVHAVCQTRLMVLCSLFLPVRLTARPARRTLEVTHKSPHSKGTSPVRRLAYSLTFALVLLLASLTSLASPGAPGTVPANTVWLPVVGNEISKRIISPVNGAYLDTLVPEFIVVPPPGGSAQIVVFREDAPPLHTRVVSADPVRLTDNLSPGTTYNWYVEWTCRIPGEQKWEICGKEWRTFTSGSGGEIPATPILIAPPDGSVFPPGTPVVLEWSSVNGCDAYVLFTQTKSLFFSGRWLDITQWGTTSPIGMNWYVKSFNGYALSEPSEVWRISSTQ